MTSPTAGLALSPSVRAALTSGRVAHLATNSADGHPHVTCIYIGVDDDGTIVSGHLHLSRNRGAAL